MHVFLSWSGERSRGMAQSLRDWLPHVIQAAKPYFSPDDMSKGSMWGGELSKVLVDTRVGLLCMTPENLNAPWLMFEAGALVKAIDRTCVIPLLFDVKQSELAGPLSMFQSATLEKAELFRVVKVVNAGLDAAALDAQALEASFEKWWPDLEHRLSLLKTAESNGASEPARPEREILEEILGTVRWMRFGWDRPEPSSLLAAAPLDALHLTSRTQSVLKGIGTTTVGSLVALTKDDLRDAKMDRSSLNEVLEVLAAHGLSLRKPRSNTGT